MKHSETQPNILRPDLSNENDIMRLVETVCHSPEFRTKEVLCRFLRYIVSETLDGRGNEIKAYSIGVDVFNRDADFDPGQDTLVRINAIRLRRMLDLYYSHTGKDDDVQITIPKGGYLPHFVSRLTSIEDLEKVSTQGSEKLIAPEPSIAVFSFDDLGGDSQNAYFARGFSYELLVELSEYEDLQVFNYLNVTGHQANSSQLHSSMIEKGIRFAIRGAIHGDKERINVLIELYDLYEERQLWSERYTEKVTVENFIELQENIAQDISGKLGSEYGIILRRLTLDSQRQKPQNITTYTAILKYYNYLTSFTAENFSQAFEALNQAVEIDPQSGIALAQLAALHGNVYALDYLNSGQSYELLGELAERAYILDPYGLMVQNAIVYKCFLYEEKDRFFQLAERMLKQSPKSTLRLGAIGFHLCLYGDWERGKQILDSVMKGHLEYPKYFFGATTVYYYRIKAYEEALAEAKMYKLPEVFWGPLLRAAVLGQLKRTEEANRELEHLKRIKPNFEQKGHNLIRRYVKEEELVIHMLEGLQKAGLDLS